MPLTNDPTGASSTEHSAANFDDFYKESVFGTKKVLLLLVLCIVGYSAFGLVVKMLLYFDLPMAEFIEKLHRFGVSITVLLIWLGYTTYEYKHILTCFFPEWAKKKIDWREMLNRQLDKSREILSRRLQQAEAGNLQETVEDELKT